MSIFLYLIAFSLSSVFCRYGIRQKTTDYNSLQLKNQYSREAQKVIFLFILYILPVLLLYGLRKGIGTDYEAYKRAYSVLHNTNIIRYLSLHKIGTGDYYMEPGYYFLNRISPNFRTLLFLCGLLTYTLIFAAIRLFQNKLYFGLPIFIYFTTHFIYSINVIRQSIALAFLLLAFAYLIKKRNLKFFVYVICAAMFHSTSWVALLYFFVQEFQSKMLNRIRDTAIVVGILLFLPVSKVLLLAASHIPQFERYFSTSLYSISFNKTSGIKWLMHIIPVIFPMVIILKSKLFESKEERMMLRIYVTEIPLRMLGFYNTWLTRFARMPQMIQIIFVPYMLRKIRDRSTQRLLVIYYTLWYIFYFVYYLLAQGGKSIHYQWIFG